MTQGVKLQFSAGTLTLTGVAEPLLGRLFPEVTWVADHRTGQWRTDAIHYQRVVQGFTRLAGNWDDQVPTWQPLHWPKTELHTLRAEQREATEQWRTHGGRATIVMPTGTGKTEVALAIMAETKTSTLVVAPVRDLMYQWHRRILATLGVDAGIVGDSVYRVSPVSVTTYDSACIHMPQLGNRFELLVFDECHHLPGPVRRDAARMSAATLRLGLTATLERSDGRHSDVQELIGPVAYELPVSAAKGRSLADYEVMCIPVHLTQRERDRYRSLGRHVREFMVERRKTDPHFGWEQVCAETNVDPEARSALRAFQEKKSIEDRAAEKLRVLEDLFRLHAGEPMIVFAGSNAMARDVSIRFLIPCLLSHCGKRERLDILQGLESGDYPAIVCNRVLDEGVDLPELKVAAVIGGLASGRQAKQRLGRVLRKHGNQRAVLYEIVTEDTGEVQRSRQRRKSDAYERTRHRQL
jgi:superfamily II DNA or RNA helicase